MMASQDSASSQTRAQLRNDGILIDRDHLGRQDAVREIIELARQNQYVILGSPPATGKTALLQLVQKELRKQGATTMRLPLTAYSTIDEIKGQLNSLGITINEQDMVNLENTWLLLDDAQNWYGKEYWPFWQFLIKNLPSTAFGRCFIIVAATYDLSTPDSPVHFATLAHFRKTRISGEEVDDLFAMHVVAADELAWFLENLKRLGRLDDDQYHIGVIVQGLFLLEHKRKCGSGVLDEGETVSALRSGDFVTFLGRCFRVPEDLPDHGRIQIIDAILHPSSSMGDEPLLMPYIRSGILARTGKFSCPAAQWFYNKTCFPRRSHTVPDSIDELVRLSVASLSASRLRNSVIDGFPKEAAFQHFFNEAMSIHLTVSNFLVPEVNTWAVDQNGEIVSGELDFYVDGHLQWCLELLRQGDKIGEHLSRFDKRIGKYREVEANQYLVVDCRPAKKGSGAQVDPNRCTLYFENNYTTCRVRMRTEEETFVPLQP